MHQVTRLVPPGRVTSYGAIAHYLGAARGARTVGYALMAANLDAATLRREAPVPAHRVVNRLGQLTGRGHFPTPTAIGPQFCSFGAPNGRPLGAPILLVTL